MCNYPCKVFAAMLDKHAWVHNLSQKSKTGFKEELYNHPCQVVPAVLDKHALVRNLSRSRGGNFRRWGAMHMWWPKGIGRENWEWGGRMSKDWLDPKLPP